MPVNYVAYIDESGDTGLQKVRTADDPIGASEWLILSCVVVSKENDNKLVSWVKEIQSKFTNNQRQDLHYADLIPAKKRIACSVLANKPCRIFIVASNKKNIERYRNPKLDPDNKSWIYWFLTRLLLERVTKFCHERSKSLNRSGDLVRVTFSRRGRMRYADLTHYLWKLKWQDHFGGLVLNYKAIVWSMIDFDEIKVHDHKSRAGLQLADIPAGAFFQALECNRAGGCEPEYAKLLKPKVFAGSTGYFIGNGLKTMPSLTEMTLNSDQRDLFEYYDFPRRRWRAPGS